MVSIYGSVGEGGENQPDDVKTVQRLLNQHVLPPLRALKVDGIAGRGTIDTIRHFQEVRLGMKNPDGRVDPGGRTMSKLREVRSSDAEREPSIKTAAMQRADQKTRQKFVRPQVKEKPVTEKIIDAILPHFKGVKATVISGYLSDTDLFWKVNWHWDYLLWMVDHALTLEITEKQKKALQAVKSSLLSCKPDPASGYRELNKIGKPEDRSSVEQFDRRYKVLRQRKRDFKKIVEAAKLRQKSNRAGKEFDLAIAPVAHPGTSKHSTGYALDIEGNNSRISAISKKLGATMTFDEKSHVHVEFKNGVKNP